ncbi:RNA polymerase sigma-I factor [Acididesulfobacillus acetoxydans]|uniref:RNA polymerase sigma factor SigI n=1 Tax=Acididesulfobacillus acetoxydans TaxID=1561005 RepID=A0A8S0XUT5_9FIRM|nr:RNA polymerase sigma-I factor [Acididesulfobacillus acetoxydans]CAA7599717.1 RNA polymerase sigma-I factor [Acididesulfobacillus acetoxydans]CEJ06269.1 spore_sigI: RNA polymerase sigma-I factor [Acididesulfobacillus acetoxydans]
MPEWPEPIKRWEDLIQDRQTREDFLAQSQPFIRHVAVQTCGRFLEWGRDEELSVALIAFDEAINRFEPGKGVPFLAFARLLIKRRLIDYFRRQKHNDALPLDAAEVGQSVDLGLSVSEFREQEENRERAQEIQEFAAELRKWGLNFRDLVQASPKHRDTRASLLRAANILAFNPALWRQVEEKGKVPIQALAAESGFHPKVLERGRKYLLAVALLMARRHDYIYLREYVIPPERRTAL